MVFIAGRYETGDLVETKSVAVKNNIDIGNKNWYVQYQKNRTIAEGTSVTSSMIWGCQWDATMKWFLKDSDTAGYVTNATGKGNYTGTIEKTGSNEEYRVKNIYDMAGNVYDWTIEASNNIARTYRGLENTTPITGFSASYRGVGVPGGCYRESGSRSMLII